MYQRNQQPNRDNYNNDDNFDSSESDSSSSDSDGENDENQEDPENALMPVNNNENNMPNNRADEAEVHNEILERIDFLGRNDDAGDDANIGDDAHPVVPFDENSRGNFDMPLLGDAAGGINLDIPPSNVNDDSSRESMDMDDGSGRPTLGNIIVERNPDSLNELKERRDSDEEPLNNFYDNDKYCSYMDNGDGVLNSKCKCSKCGPSKKSCNNNSTDSKCCDKRRACLRTRRNLDEVDDMAGASDASSSSSSNNVAVSGVAGPSAGAMVPLRRRKECSSDEEDDLDLGSKKLKLDNCDKKKKRKSSMSDEESNSLSTDESSKENDDSNCGCANGDDIELDERENEKECTCYEDKLDHVNGHSSKMCLELPKTPCEKCLSKRQLAAEKEMQTNAAASSGGASGSMATTDGDKENGDGDGVDKAENALGEPAAVAEPNVVNNIRPRDGEVEVARPSKRARLNNGSTANKPKAPRTIFHRALDAVNMTWDNQHLKNILAGSTYREDSSNAIAVAGTSAMVIISAQKSNFNANGQPLWHEPLAMCAARIDSLRSHGHTEAALRLSVSVVRTMKQIQKDGQLLWNRYQSITNIQIQDDIPKPTTCCSECSGNHKMIMSGRNMSGASTSATTSSQQNFNNHAHESAMRHGNVSGGSGTHHGNSMSSGHHSGSHSSSSSSASRHKRPYDHSSRSHHGHGYPMNGYMGGPMPHKDPYKMYRYDYGGHGGHGAPYRYGGNAGGMGHDDCRRCLEARERANYAHGYHHSNRMHINGNGLPPAFFRNGSGSNGGGGGYHGPMNGGNIYDHRFGHFGAPIGYNGRFGNGGHHYMPSMPPANACHAENCNIQHRPQHGMMNEAFGDMYGMSRATCSSYDIHQYMGPGRYNGAANNHHCGPNDSRARDLCNVSSQAHNNGRMSQRHHCKMIEPSAGQIENMPGPSGTSSLGAPSSSSSQVRESERADAEPRPGCSKDLNMQPSTSSNEPPAKKPCTQHTKNQCCIKNNFCRMPNADDKSKCCSSSGNNFSRQPCSSSGNIYFGMHRDHHHHHQHHYNHSLKDDSSSLGCNCRCNRPSATSTVTSNSSSNSTNTNAVNAGASTSKATSTTNPTTEFVRKRKSGCTSNCLDCSIGCDIEFPLDAVACIFDCLTEACIIPDSVNAPDMGRLTFDSVTGSAEDGSIIPPRYRHVPVPFSQDTNETYLTLAFEAAVLALGKQRVMPHGLYSQHVIYKQHEQLIQRLRHVDLDRLLVDALKQLTTQLLDGGPSSGLGKQSKRFSKISSHHSFFIKYFSLHRTRNSSGIDTNAHAGPFLVHIVAESTCSFGIPRGVACHAFAYSRGMHFK